MGSGGLRAVLIGVALAAVLVANAPAAAHGQTLYWDEINGNGNQGSSIARWTEGSVTVTVMRENELAEPIGVAVDGAHLYFSWFRAETIGRLNLDNSGYTPEMIKNAGGVVALALDRHHVYFASTGGFIGRANLDGSGVQYGFISSNGKEPYGVAVDNHHVYWTERPTGEIGRANLDGTGVNTGFIKGASAPQRLAVDGGHIYWANRGGNSIGRANLDGTSVNQKFITAAEPGGVAVSAQGIAWTAVAETKGAIGAANLDGTGAHTVLTRGFAGNTKLRSIAFAAEAPTANTNPASAITPTAATLNATVNPNGREVSECVFEYGTTTAYGSSAPCAPEVGNGASAAATSSSLAGLTAATEYHFRVLAANIGGVAAGADETFKTAPRISQTISFSSTPPGDAVVGGPTYEAAAEASSKLPVTLSIDPVSAGVCSISGSTVSFVGTGTCTIDADQAGSGEYQPAPRAQQSFHVAPSGPPPSVTSLKPKTGPAAGGTTVTIKGANLANSTAVSFGGVKAAGYTVQSATVIIAVSPAAAVAGAADVTVTTPNGTSATVKKDQFKYAPVITALTPNAGPQAGGTQVTVDGTGFAPGKTATTFKFGKTKSASVECTSNTTCTISAPAHPAGGVDVIATVAKVKSAKSPPADQFTYN